MRDASRRNFFLLSHLPTFAPSVLSCRALLFEGGLVLICIPVMAWWLQVGLLEALVYEAGLIVLFIAYTYLFTWGFDQVFGLPASAR